MQTRTTVRDDVSRLRQDSTTEKKIDDASILRSCVAFKPAFVQVYVKRGVARSLYKLLNWSQVKEGRRAARPDVRRFQESHPPAPTHVPDLHPTHSYSVERMDVLARRPFTLNMFEYLKQDFCRKIENVGLLGVSLCTIKQQQPDLSIVCLHFQTAVDCGM